ncbi:MAG: sigma-70 family RNA polymerase sigma factor [Pseudomonadota bacterium]
MSSRFIVHSQLRMSPICTTISPSSVRGFILTSPPQRTSQSGLLEKWYSEHFTALVNFLRSRFGVGPPDPEDIAQRTFTQVLGKVDFQTVTNPRAYLWRVAHNFMVSEHRAIGAAERGVGNLTAITDVDEGYLLVPERVLEAEAQVQTALRVIGEMPERRRDVLILVRVDGLTLRETASRLGISSAAASKHLAKATETLYYALLDTEIDPNDG